MNKILVITVFVALLRLSAQGLRLPRQAEEGTPEEPVADVEEADGEQGTLERLTSAAKSYYQTSISTASSWLGSIDGLKLKEKATNVLSDTTVAAMTYAGILQDQVYHIFYQA
uniref:Apolipoprotein C-II n=1 Tax=Salmo trutta TaxID=8032 RepID=A0A674B581_SALTR